jgi:hypothetical protein
MRSGELGSTVSALVGLVQVECWGIVAPELVGRSATRCTLVLVTQQADIGQRHTGVQEDRVEHNRHERSLPPNSSFIA